VTLGIVFILFISLLALGLLGSFVIIGSARFGRRFASTLGVSSSNFGRVRVPRTRPPFVAGDVAKAGTTIRRLALSVTLKDLDNFKLGRRP